MTIINNGAWAKLFPFSGEIKSVNIWWRRYNDPQLLSDVAQKCAYTVGQAFSRI